MAGSVPGGEMVKALMLEPHPVTVQTMETNSASAGYGFGLDIGKYKGHAIHVHEGSWVGFGAFYARFPDDNFSIVLLCNRSDAGDGNKVGSLVDLAFSEFVD
jgi:CubicO group peptidase (beta-lactamase class C family)